MDMESVAPEAAPIPPVAVQPLQVVEDDRMCVRCGYNLRTLLLDSNCPECAAPVSNSFLSDELEFSHPEWVNWLARGVGMGCIGVALFILLMVLAITEAITKTPAAIVYYTFLFYIPMLLMMLGAISFTKAETSRKEATPDPKPRRFARVVVVIWTSMTIGSLMFNLAWRYIAITSAVNSVLHVVSLLNTVLALAIFPALLLYARHIARRSSSPRLETWARVLFIMHVILTTTTLLGMCYLIVTSGRAGSGVMRDGLAGVLGCYGAVTMLFTFVFAVLLYSALRTDRTSARNFWRSMDHATQTN
ncbi:MAG: hypothetical protein IPK83_07695 [Planctomycetes bacterium]|nr:hypothetical protein [Planctomycetota bacterium]